MGANHLPLNVHENLSFIIRAKRRLMVHIYKSLLRFYLIGTAVVQLPFIGKIFRRWIEWYGATQHGGKIVSKEEAYHWIEKAGNILCSICYCRDIFKHCSNSLHVCLRISNVELFQSINNKNTRLISPQEAKEIIAESEKMKLVHIIAWCSYPHVYAICNCCSCCCVAWQIWKRYGIKSVLQKGEMIIYQSSNLCTNCGKCVEQCKFEAIEKSLTEEVRFNPQKCFGCGMCRQVCENNAIKLVKR